MNNQSNNNIASYQLISIKELLILFLSSIIFLIFGTYLFNKIWLSEYGGNLPNSQLENEELTTYFHTKNLRIFLEQFFKKFFDFEKNYLLRSIGTEAYMYLIFLKYVLRLLIIMVLVSLIISLISTLSNKEPSFFNFVEDFLFNNKKMDDFNSFLHLIAIFIYTFLHFRCFSQIRQEARNIYFEKFDLLSREKNFNWLSSRTLHISGLSSDDRNSKIKDNNI
jgi:hypothetical protein